MRTKPFHKFTHLQSNSDYHCAKEPNNFWTKLLAHDYSTRELHTSLPHSTPAKPYVGSDVRLWVFDCSPHSINLDCPSTLGTLTQQHSNDPANSQENRNSAEDPSVLLDLPFVAAPERTLSHFNFDRSCVPYGGQRVIRHCLGAGSLP